MTKKRSDKVFADNHFNPFTAKTETQKELFNALNSHQLVFARGPAGTGKTAVITSYAAQKLHDKSISKIIVTRPAIEAAGEKLGFLPGSLIDDKFMPYIQPVQGIFEEVLGKSFYEHCLKSGKIEPVPLAYMRGRTFKDAIVIADEVQGMTPEQMEMLCTRIGVNCKLFCAGDEEQSDIRGINGLTIACEYLKWMPSCKIITFNLEDIVRSEIVADVVMSFRRYKEKSL